MPRGNHLDKYVDAWPGAPCADSRLGERRGTMHSRLRFSLTLMDNLFRYAGQRKRYVTVRSIVHGPRAVGIRAIFTRAPYRASLRAPVFAELAHPSASSTRYATRGLSWDDSFGTIFGGDGYRDDKPTLRLTSRHV